MSKPLVYLAGPIAGWDYRAVTNWRAEAKFALTALGIEALSPMRCKDALADQNDGKISTDFHDYERNGPFFRSRGIMTRDYNDVCRSDALLVNLLGTTKVSAGTVMELAWAYHLRIPAIVVIEREGNIHDNHPMIAEAIPFRVETLADGIDAVAAVLNR